MSDPALPDAPLFHTATYTDPQQVLETVFGYRDFRPGQRRIIDAVLAGRDCIGVMPTGAGKSLTFQLPAKLLNLLDWVNRMRLECNTSQKTMGPTYCNRRVRLHLNYQLNAPQHSWLNYPYSWCW